MQPRHKRAVSSMLLSEAGLAQYPARLRSEIYDRDLNSPTK